MAFTSSQKKIGVHKAYAATLLPVGYYLVARYLLAIIIGLINMIGIALIFGIHEKIRGIVKNKMSAISIIKVIMLIFVVFPIASGALAFSKTEPRYDDFWRNFMNEKEEVKTAVRKAFPEMNQDLLGGLVDHALKTGQLSGKYDRDFIYKTVTLYFNNMDAFIHIEMTEDEIMNKVDQVVSFLRDSFC